MLDAGLSSRPGAEAPGVSPCKGGAGRCLQELLSAETDRQAVPRVCVFFPPPASAVVLVVSPVAHRGPHASTAHRAVAATLAVVVRALHGQFHAAVLLMIQVGARERVGRRGRNGWGRQVVDGFQRRSSFNANLSARNGGHPEGRWRQRKPGLSVGGHDQCSGSGGLRFATGHRQGGRQAGQQGSRCL